MFWLSTNQHNGAAAANPTSNGAAAEAAGGPEVVELISSDGGAQQEEDNIDEAQVASSPFTHAIIANEWLLFVVAVVVRQTAEGDFPTAPI